ncbi:MAG: 3'-5' exonuclease [Planctomycetaceae bacterium]|nr:3'-5' exonuclease [Planctomycetales bacterium]MCB9922475.1 3'-5' exonuclease [Planctomycetaceae bacterium]
MESVADGQLVSKIRYPGEGLSPEDAIARYRAELMEKNGTDFIPYSFQYPVSVVVAKVTSEFQLLDIVALDDPKFRPHVITEHFWRGWEAYRHPTFVTFNGRTFDLPLMELAAFRFGLSVPAWFDIHGKSYSQPRYRYNSESHFDLYELMTNFGASRLNGGLNLAATMLGKPGKMSVQGYMVQDLFAERKVTEINDYCRCDVLDTYFVFLRSAVMIGQLTLDREQELIAEAYAWLTDRAEDVPAYALYLEHWGDWSNPWEEPQSKTE